MCALTDAFLSQQIMNVFFYCMCACVYAIVIAHFVHIVYTEAFLYLSQQNEQCCYECMRLVHMCACICTLVAQCVLVLVLTRSLRLRLSQQNEQCCCRQCKLIAEQQQRSELAHTRPRCNKHWRTNQQGACGRIFLCVFGL